MKTARLNTARFGVLLLVFLLPVGYASSRITRYFAYTAPVEKKAVAASPTQAVQNANPLPSLGTLKIPTLILVGTADTTVPPAQHGKAAAAALKSCATLYEKTGATHADGYEERFPAMLRFVQAHTRRGSAIVMLHQYTGSGDTIRRYGFYTELRRAGYRVLTPSFGNAWGNDTAVAQLEAAVKGEKKIALVGASMGGALMWRYALRHPKQVTCMVGVNPVCDLAALCHSEMGQSIVQAYR